jgi:hypothetical protein
MKSQDEKKPQMEERPRLGYFAPPRHGGCRSAKGLAHAGVRDYCNRSGIMQVQGFSFGVRGSLPGARAKGAFLSRYGGVNHAAVQQKVLDKSCVL